MAGTYGGPVFCVCWHGRGIKDREVNGMKHRILTVCLLLALLLTACGGQNREPENPPDAKPSAPGEEAAEPPDETPEPEPAKPEEKEPLSLEDVLTDIYTVAPGTAGSSLRATYAAGELLDWIDVNSVEQEDVFRWIDENVPMENAAELARAWAAVLTEAEALMRGDETAYDALDDAGYTMEQPYRSTGRVKWAAWKLLPLFTQILDRTERTEYRYEAPGDYSAVTEEALAGIWVDDAGTTVLLFSEDGCRIVYPELELLGETAYAFRVRDRSSVGYCPELDIDYLQNDFSAPLVYYVSGIDDTHFWSNTQNKCFRRLA